MKRPAKVIELQMRRLLAPVVAEAEPSLANRLAKLESTRKPDFALGKVSVGRPSRPSFASDGLEGHPTTAFSDSSISCRGDAPAAAAACGRISAMAFLLAFALLAIPALAEEKGQEAVRPAGARRLAVGVGSCSAQPCHGSVRPDAAKLNLWDIRGDEVTVWIERDPHAQAFRVLSNELSRQMAERLKLGVPATEAQRCLRCHSPFDVAPARDGKTVLADGVSCEACHGAAQDWLAPHTVAGWRQRSAEDKKSLGLRETRNLHARAEACAACHVGTGPKDGEPGDDVNHDLIAAGHPALKFELTAYLAKMPKHWEERLPGTSNPPGPDFEARAWAVGQVTSAAAALKLLAYRADEGRKKPWPEFAEYDCYSCHHQLYGPRERARLAGHKQAATEDAAADRQRLGLPTWGTWYLSLVGAVPESSGEVGKTLGGIDRLMQSPGANRRRIARAAREAGGRFDTWAKNLADRQALPSSLAEVLGRLKREAPRASEHWDGEAQLYLALVALHYARHGAQPPPANDPLTRSLRETRDQLMFPVAGQRRFDSPRNLDPAAALHERLLPEIERLMQE